MISDVGCVIIGRNEGDRLRRCLMSLVGRVAAVVYVDSGSTDASVALAHALGVTVVELDMAIPFTAARGRNEGFRALQYRLPLLPYIQFVDGDCEVLPGWLDAAREFLESHPEVAVACGRRRERYPEHSIYNRLCDMEWDTPLGEAKACGGDAMIRAAALVGAGGYRSDLIAGEEPELCIRLRLAGWKVWRIDHDMTLHDAAMTRFGQWWKRSVRSGHAFAEGAYLHGASSERHWVRESLRAWLWGGVMPVLILLGVPLFGWGALAPSALYPLQMLRLALQGAGSLSLRDSWLRAVFVLLGKFPEFEGQVRYWVSRLRPTKVDLIEYK
jgi:GT2 family glycosyltransferase